ncbi:glycosyltransferase involved in cell wall biosynthesis [Winogradskyella eximia]|jgi:glycosyltransferase involved in cell wall biosynthesis|uniref:Glycosyltransferase involved in cell wall biosynthesis n=1 Tax=Winogradskyella eximia TaxID=262006 RepID=A0A3D9H0G6_9FLAO|nr:glycosyltransferase family 2 protein [Winogradskyella eximia]RED43003.1 glycosyltransferase involved in cell wall biosynthesis [Winogradskyella eximia]|tara:strand:+ start:12006 stop:12956 length:951 start_codon:yes stop_codon:yes gene_type:complete
MDISVVIPLLNEEESLKELHDWIASVMLSNQFSYEILFIDDGSTDKSWQIISELGHINPNVKGIRFLKNFGKSQALHAGFAKATGDVVVTMDADLQDNPEEIPELFKMIKTDKFDLVSGWKKKRYDSYFSKNLPSKLFNWAARRTSGVTLNDFNCGLKAYSNTVVKHIDVYGEMHRYIPVLAKNAGFINIGEKVVQHQARKYGTTKFGMNRFINGFLDLITIWFLSRFGKRPMHLFGAIGVLMFIIGFGFSFYLGLDKLFFNPLGRLITERPQFYIALSTMIIGSQFFIAGFLGELILRSNRQQQRYFIKEHLNLK